MSRRRTIPSAVCECGARQAQLKRLWLNHTLTCDAWKNAHAHLFTSVSLAVPDLTTGAGPVFASELANEYVDSTELEPADAQVSADMEALPQREQAPISALSLPRLNERLRDMRRPRLVLDAPPVGPEPFLAAPDRAQTNVGPTPRVRLLVWHSTAPNLFGLYRKYIHPHESVPVIPDIGVSTRNFTASQSHNELAQSIIAPFPNLSTFLLAHWFFTGGTQKSLGSRRLLINNVILAPGFSPEHFVGVSAEALDRLLDRIDTDDNGPIREGGNWIETIVTISIPLVRRGGRGRAPAASSKSFDEFGTLVSVPGFHHRDLVDVIVSHFSYASARPGIFHFVPYRHMWQPGVGQPEQRVYGELYTSNLWIIEHEHLQRSPPVEGCKLERAIVAMMIWSDATHLAQFGQSSLWPIYLQFGNRSKDDRARPSMRLTEHIGYLPKITGNIQTHIEAALGGKAINQIMSPHVDRETFHACWRVLLNDRFVDAYRQGIVVECTDRVTRRLYPRIFTYAADYPEKVLVGSIRQFGLIPALQDLVPKVDIHKLGSFSDRKIRAEKPRMDNDETRKLVHNARQKIYQEGYAINSGPVEALLKPTSSVPTINAFSQRLAQFPSFKLYRMLIPDALHELDLGVCKALLIHLIRMLHTQGPQTISRFDARFRQIINFPPETIRKFGHNVSEMKKMAARDWEDILQCCIPCFEGLFPKPHSDDITVIIYTLAQWHALAKLRMHTDATVDALDAHTTVLGRRLRRFQKSSVIAFKTTETDREFDARRRRKEKNQANKNKQAASSSEASESAVPMTRLPKEFSLTTYKLHALGDYTGALRDFGSTDSYSTQNGELEHRHVKGHGRRTNQKNIAQDVGVLERREARLDLRMSALKSIDSTSSTLDPSADEALVSDERKEEDLSPESHYTISVRGETVRLIDFFQVNRNDPAVENFVSNLQTHLLDRLQNPLSGMIEPIMFSDLERQSVILPSGAIYRHATFRVNYTSYDVRRIHDVINPRFKHHFIMVANGDDSPDHPFWYAKVLGVFHTNVFRRDVSETSVPRRVNFLWVRWMEVVESGSWERCTMDRVQYLPKVSYRDRFGFLDPELVIRACHLIPVFTLGRTISLGAGSLALDDALEGDWSSYYVNRFVDRDMFMRYWGGGVGHLGSIPTSVPTTMPADDEDDDEEVLDEDVTMTDEHSAEDDSSSDDIADTDDEGSDDDWDLHASTD